MPKNEEYSIVGANDGFRLLVLSDDDPLSIDIPIAYPIIAWRISGRDVEPITVVPISSDLCETAILQPDGSVIGADGFHDDEETWVRTRPGRVAR